MSGVAVAWSLMTQNPALISAVPAAQIKAGVLPLNTPLPAIGLTSVSAVRRNTAGMHESRTMVTERVQATVMVKTDERGGGDYRNLQSILSLLRRACPHTNGTVNGVSVLSVLHDLEGPDLEDTGIITRSQDLIIRWSEAR